LIRENTRFWAQGRAGGRRNDQGTVPAFSDHGIKKNRTERKGGAGQGLQLPIKNERGEKTAVGKKSGKGVKNKEKMRGRRQIASKHYRWRG